MVSFRGRTPGSHPMVVAFCQISVKNELRHQNIDNGLLRNVRVNN